MKWVCWRPPPNESRVVSELSPMSEVGFTLHPLFQAWLDPVSPTKHAILFYTIPSLSGFLWLWNKLLSWLDNYGGPLHSYSVSITGLPSSLLWGPLCPSLPLRKAWAPDNNNQSSQCSPTSQFISLGLWQNDWSAQLPPREGTSAFWLLKLNNSSPFS